MTDHTDLGVKVSSFVAHLDGVGRGTGGATGGATGAATSGAGVAGGRGIGVSTLIIGNIAYVGIDPTTLPGGMATTGTTGATGTLGHPGADGTYGDTGAGASATGTAGAGTGVAGMTLEDIVRTRVRSSFPQIANVHVTTTPRLVYRLALVSGQVIAGIPADRYLNEVFDIAWTMTPGTTGAAGTPGRTGTTGTTGR